jgi:hypothetical protein
MREMQIINSVCSIAHSFDAQKMNKIEYTNDWQENGATEFSYSVGGYVK